jgi:hypothetical protein
MTKKIQSYLVVLLLVLPALTFGASWSGSGVVNNLRIHNGNQVYGHLQGITLVCGNSNFLLVGGFAKEEQVFAMLLTAQTTGKAIKVFQTGECDGAWTLINGVYFVE